MRILVDIGNSRCKSCIEEDGQFTALETFAWHDVFIHDVLKKVWLEPLSDRVPDSIQVSNVAGDRLLPNLSAWCCSQWNQTPVAIESQAEFDGLRNGYLEPTTLGVDRWAAMAGARKRYQGPLCVVDSGTATTVDVIDETGQHIGGAILPGIYTMRRSLGKYTAALFAADGEISPFSNNTAAGIAGGTGYASVGAIERLMLEAKKAVGDTTTVITGGEAEVLEGLLTIDAVIDPLLVLHGVAVLSESWTEEQLRERSRCD
jgi:type III pantothenate kinase